MFSNRYIFTYATIMIIIVASILATASNLLKPMQEMNIKNEKYKSILITAKVLDDKQKIKPKELEELYFRTIQESFVLNSKGEKIEGVEAFSVDMAAEIRKPQQERNLPVYLATLETGEREYIIPMRGRGLWGPVWGYMAIKSDGVTIAGVTFGHKSETPGLGAEIVGHDFTDQFVGKSIFDDNFTFTSVKVIKGGAQPDNPHGVDAISGGTITSNGVTDMIHDCLAPYQEFFRNLK